MLKSQERLLVVMTKFTFPLQKSLNFPTALQKVIFVSRVCPPTDFSAAFTILLEEKVTVTHPDGAGRV